MTNKIDGNLGSNYNIGGFDDSCRIEPKTQAPKEQPELEEDDDGLFDALAEGLEIGQRFMEEVGDSTLQAVKDSGLGEPLTMDVRSLIDEGAKLAGGVRDSVKGELDERLTAAKDATMEVAKGLDLYKELGQAEVTRRVDNAFEAVNQVKQGLYDEVEDKLNMGKEIGQSVGKQLSDKLERVRDDLSLVDADTLTDAFIETFKETALDFMPETSIRAAGELVAKGAKIGAEGMIEGAEALQRLDHKLQNGLESLGDVPFVGALFPVNLLQAVTDKALAPGRDLTEAIITHGDDLLELTKIADPSFHADQIRALQPGDEHQVVLKGQITVKAGMGVTLGEGLQAQVTRDFEDNFEIKLTSTDTLGVGLGVGAGGKELQVGAELQREDQGTLVFQGKGEQAQEAIARLLTYQGSLKEAMNDPLIKDHLSLKSYANKDQLSGAASAGVFSAKGGFGAETALNHKDGEYTGQLNLSNTTEIALSMPGQLSGVPASERLLKTVATSELGEKLGQLGILDNIAGSEGWRALDLALGTNTLPEGKLVRDTSVQIQSNSLSLQNKFTLEVGSHTYEITHELKAKDLDKLAEAIGVIAPQLATMSAQDIMERCEQRSLKLSDLFEAKQTDKLTQFTGPGIKVPVFEASSKSGECIYARTVEAGKETVVHKDKLEEHLGAKPEVAQQREARVMDLYHRQIRG